MKILIVEDDSAIALGLEYSLQAEQFETILCEDVTSAKKVISENLSEIDLCLFDLSLPDGSGYDLCRMVKEAADIPVIFLTALDDEVNVVMGLDMGADDYITKPFRFGSLYRGLIPYYAAIRNNKNRPSLALKMCKLIHYLGGLKRLDLRLC